MARRRQRAYTNLGADMAAIADLGEQRMLQVMQKSFQDLIENIQTPTAKGGRMRVDTGFLRASGQASLNGMPSGPNEKPEGATSGSVSYTDNTVTVLLNMNIGDTFYFGWTANYAQHRELYDGFLEGGLQNWGRIVAFNADFARENIK